jgi:hypothetical protein
MASTRAVSGTRRAMKELVDGTLRVQVDIDPEHRRDFLRLFPDIDARVALAPLKPEAAAKPDDALKGGELAKLAGILCSEIGFQAWVEGEFGEELPASVDLPLDDDAERAAVILRHVCGIASRAELDHKQAAATIFHERIRKPWAERRHP